jgi:Zn-dependent protease with chaperone function
MSTAQPNVRHRFPGIDPIALQHPYDRAALGALQRVPGLDVVVRKFIELFPEKVAYIQNVAQTVRVSSTQCPQLYGYLQEACVILDMPEPELYVAQHPVPNAYTSGCERPYIVVTTGLLDLMNETEVLAVIAHELGHIKSGHVLYKTMARCISLLLTIIGDMTLGLGRLIGRSLEAALLEWDRKSEFTADRASLLVVQDSQVMLSLMMKLAGGTLFQRDQMNAQEFLKQADLYQDVDVNLLDRMYKLLMVSAVSHPLIIVRARESVNWAESQQYKEILAGRYPRVPTFGNNGNSNRSTSGKATGMGSTSGTPASTPTPPTSSESRLVHCPHCDREQTNQRFCSFCGETIV